MGEGARRRFATRLNSFRKGGVDAADAVRRVAEVDGVSAVELNFPQHFGGEAPVLDAAAEAGLEVTALNLRWDGADFDHVDLRVKVH